MARVIRTVEAEFQPDITAAELNQLQSGRRRPAAITTVDLRSTIPMPGERCRG
jgi:hypothetical protein